MKNKLGSTKKIGGGYEKGSDLMSRMLDCGMRRVFGSMGGFE